MARAERRRARESGGRSWWWLAVPALAIAGYAAFAGTLALLGGDASRPAGEPQEPTRHLAMPAPAAPPPAADAGPAAAAVPQEVAAPAPRTDPAAAAADVPDTGPTASPAAQRAAADGAAARKVKPKQAPQEHLTDQDRRALDAIVEQAGKSR